MRLNNFKFTLNDELTDQVILGYSKKTYEILLFIPLMLAGSTLIGIANNSIDPIIVSLLFLIVGIIINQILFRASHYEIRSFLLSYSICVMVAGLAHLYSLSNFGILQSTPDASTFYNLISPSPPFTTFEDIPLLFNSPLAILIWQQIYKITWLLGLKVGPYIGVLFNGFVVGLCGSITVRIAREIFGHDSWRLRRVGTLFALCGIFWLFGSIFIRGSFILFINVLIFWMIIRWLQEPIFKNLFLGLVIITFSSYCLSFLRQKSVLLVSIFLLMAFIFWIKNKRLDKIRFLSAILIILIVIFSYLSLYQYYETSAATLSIIREAYANASEFRGSNVSLGTTVIVNQPLPVRLVAGSGYMLIFPFPFWSGLNASVNEYHIIKSIQAVYKLLIMPLVIAGILIVLRDWKKKENKSLHFLTTYLFVALFSVVLSTLETRHLGQFFHAFVLLAAVADTRHNNDKYTVINVSFIWFFIIIILHLLWIYLTL